jgi:HK97 family phage portal protein
MNLLEKTIGYLGLNAWFPASRHDDQNFRTNQVTLADYADSGAGTAGGVMGLSTAWACVRLVAGTISSLPLVVFKRGAAGREPAFEHPLYELLHDRPNADQTALNFWQFMSGAIELQGNAYAEIVRAGDGRVIALAPPFAPDMVQPKRSAVGSIIYELRGNDRRTLPQERMLHVRGFGGNPLGGLSTLAYGRQTFGMAQALERTAAATFRNGVRPSGILSIDRPLTGEQRQSTEEALREKYTGSMNAGVPMLLDNGVKWQGLSINPNDAQMLESRAFSVEEICRFFQVPPHMIGHTEKSTSWGTGIEQMTIGFLQFTLRERLKNIESALEQQLLSPVERKAGMRIEFNLDGLLRGDSKARAEVNEIYVRMKSRTINEVRAQDNLPPVPWGDRPWGQMQDVQLNELGQVPAAPRPPAQPAIDGGANG